ncbi:L-threonylcarbamoyladenylate synthase [Methylohalomonas lacus]|uniref:Threonylcarbamoyl-AMP synthase n=1 Tax=Methylohalomonas lacus TaxID=398773 RepID=A0AAE3L4U9_9GAMM|nr:Sua5/YciO/YrdC/YwlC family protein [Methylohalomonas lacus]MCS3904508.1 L-threonylcarbamoyladenylate synthase [Methylohalomonas lacus]
MSAANSVPTWKTAPALRALTAHGVIAYPTEAVYGLGCLPQRAPVQRLLRIKRRSPRKGLILIGAYPDQFRRYIDFADARVDWMQVFASWPGAVTWLLPTRPGTPAWLTGEHTSLAVRVSDHPLVQALCARSGAIISTSANPAGCVPARDPARVRAYFGGQLDYVLNGPLGGRSQPSEIRYGLTGAVIRPATG